MPNLEALDIDLASIQDPGARAAISAIADFVNDLVATGIKTKGSVKAESDLTIGADERFTVDADGNMKSRSFQSHGETKKWCVAFREGSIGAGEALTLKVPGRAFGVLGVSSFDGNAGVTWPIEFNDTINDPANDLGINLFLIVDGGVTLNNPSTNANKYRCAIFYERSDG